MPPKPPLIIPVENQVRELDPKLLLAAVAARSGFSSVIGSHREIDFRIAAFPPGLYLNKSMTDRNLKMFRIMRRLGHQILTWDEEALVHLPPAIYYSRRLSPTAIGFVSHLFAWGENNAALWRRYPDLPQRLPIHVTGNPRNDMLRSELQSFYDDEVRAIRERYGDYLLVNTNFNHVNAFFPAQNIFKPVKHPGEVPRFGKAGVGMTRDFAEALAHQKQAVFKAFLVLIPELARAFPGLAIIVRPHPTESPDAYQRAAAAHERVHVTNEGNVVPWLRGARAVIHNGCTTGVEAFVMAVPAFSYRPSVSAAIDDTFYLLPHGLSHQCFGLPELFDRIRETLAGRLGPAGGTERADLLRRYLTGLDGPLACERIVAVLEAIAADRWHPSPPTGLRRLGGVALAKGRFWFKQVKAHLPGSHAPPEFHRHRYPGIRLADLRQRLQRFQDILGHTTALAVEAFTDHIFKVRPAE